MAKKDEIKVIRSITTSRLVGEQGIIGSVALTLVILLIRFEWVLELTLPQRKIPFCPYECSDEDVNVLLQFCSNGRCVNLMRVLVKRTSLDAHIQVGGLTRTRFAQSNATQPAQEHVRVCVCVMVVVDS